MTNIDAGLFFTMIAVSVIFLVSNIRYKEYFYFVPTFLFLVLGMWLMQGNTVSFYSTTTDGVNWINQTSWVIGNDATQYDIYAPWLGLGFILGAIILGFVAFLGLTDPKKDIQK